MNDKINKRKITNFVHCVGHCNDPWVKQIRRLAGNTDVSVTYIERCSHFKVQIEVFTPV